MRHYIPDHLKVIRESQVHKEVTAVGVSLREVRNARVAQKTFDIVELGCTDERFLAEDLQEQGTVVTVLTCWLV